MSLVLTNPPKKYWIAVDTHNLTTTHNLGFVGELFSMGWAAQSLGPELGQAYASGTLDYLPYTRNPNQSQIGMAPFQLTASRDYSVEVMLETARQKIDPLLPSRLSAVFAFDSIKQAAAIGKKVNRPVPAGSFWARDGQLPRPHERSNFPAGRTDGSAYEDRLEGHRRWASARGLM